MRISTNSIYATSTTQLGTLQAQLARTQMQLSTNKRMLAPADDPIASARALEVTQSQSINTQYATNRANARSALSQEEVALNGVQTLIQDVQGIAVAAGSGANTASDRATYADQLQGRLDDLVALANSSDGNGGYVFAGYGVDHRRSCRTAPPSITTATRARCSCRWRRAQAGHQRRRQLGVHRHPTGNGTFATAANGGNTGTGTISTGSVVDPSAADRPQLQHRFRRRGTPASTTYTVTDQTAVPPAAGVSGASYVSGEPITVAGMQFDISGTPGRRRPVHRQAQRPPVPVHHHEQADRHPARPGDHRQDKAALSKGLHEAHRQPAPAWTTCWPCAPRSARA